MTAQPIIDAISNLSHVIQREPVPRTGQPLSSVYGPFTFITHRIIDFEYVITTLPAIAVDITPHTSIEYENADTALFRLIPLTVGVYIPIMDRGLSDEDSLAEDIKADEDLKNVYNDLESVLLSWGAQRGSAYQLRFARQGSGIYYEAFEWDEPVGIKVRVGQIQLYARSQVR